jgi:hypothetical protein
MLLHRFGGWLSKRLVEGDFRLFPWAFDGVLHTGKTRHTVTDELVDQKQCTADCRCAPTISAAIGRLLVTGNVTSNLASILIGRP